MEFKHIPVLFRESIDALDIKPDGLYADCTAGGGGHSNAILDRLSENGRLVAIDRDPEAIETLTKRFEGRENVSIVNDNFFNIKSILSQFTDEGADGILADLGVSSHQLDDAARGFSFHADAPLDMRMSMQGMSAADAVNSLSQRELQDIIYRYGEDKFAPRIAAGIVRARAEKPIETTLELAEIVKNSSGSGAPRGRPPREAHLPGVEDLCQRRARRTRQSNRRYVRFAQGRRQARDNNLPFARGQSGQADFRLPVRGVYMPAGVPGVRLREKEPRQIAAKGGGSEQGGARRESAQQKRKTSRNRENQINFLV